MTTPRPTWPVWATDLQWLQFTQQLAQYYTNRTGVSAWTTQFREQSVAPAYVLPLARTLILHPHLLGPEIPSVFPRRRHDRRTSIDLTLRGLIAHEAGHVRFSCAKPAGEALGQLWNILEDERIERRMAHAHEHARISLGPAFDLLGDHILARNLRDAAKEKVPPEKQPLIWWTLVWRAGHDHPLFNHRPSDPRWEGGVRQLVEQAWVADTSEEVVELAQAILDIVGNDPPMKLPDVSATGAGSEQREEPPPMPTRQRPAQPQPKDEDQAQDDTSEAESQEPSTQTGPGDAEDGETQDSSTQDTDASDEGQESDPSTREQDEEPAPSEHTEEQAEQDDTTDSEGEDTEGHDEGDPAADGEGDGGDSNDETSEPQAPGAEGTPDGGEDEGQDPSEGSEAEGQEHSAPDGSNDGEQEAPDTHDDPGEADGPSDPSADADEQDTREEGDAPDTPDGPTEEGHEDGNAKLDTPDEQDAPAAPQEPHWTPAPSQAREPQAPKHVLPQGQSAHELNAAPTHSPLDAVTIESMARTTSTLLKATTRPGLESASMTRGRFSYERHYARAERQFRHRTHPTRTERVHVSFVGDRSGSMSSRWNGESTRLQGMHAAACIFTRAAQLDGTVLHAVLFDDNTYVVTDERTPVNEAPARIRTHEAFRPGGYTLLWPALQVALGRVIPPGEHHLIVIACDGELDPHDQLRVQDLVRRRGTNTAILPLLIGEDACLGTWQTMFPGAQVARRPQDLVRLTQTVVAGLRRGEWRARPANGLRS